VTAHVDGIAASAATFLTAVADKTVMAPARC
jgi:ClpP class serine protease